MGQFGRVDMIIGFDTSVDAIAVSEEIIQEDKLNKFITDNTEGSFHFNIDDVSVADEFVYITVTSNRVTHAEWMVDMIHKYLIEVHRDVVKTITAEMTTPETIIEWYRDEE